MTNLMDREAVSEPHNVLGMDGIEFIEFATSKPQALVGVLERMGFRPIARHRSREVELYRQGGMNIIVNAQAADVPRTVQPTERPVLSAFAVRVRDADAAFHRALELGAWEIPVRARATARLRRNARRTPPAGPSSWDLDRPAGPLCGSSATTASSRLSSS